MDKILTIIVKKHIEDMYMFDVERRVNWYVTRGRYSHLNIYWIRKLTDVSKGIIFL